MGSFQRNAFPLVMAVFLAVAVGSFITTRGAQEASLIDQEQHLAELEERKADLEAEHDERVHLVADQVSGTDGARLNADQQVIGRLLNTALTWESHTEYENARTTLMNVYDIPEDSAFMTAFLPEAPMNIDDEGTEYPLIDLLGLDSRVDDFRTELMSIQGTEYAYLVLADVWTTSDDGQADARNTATVLLTTDGEGGVFEVEGYAATSRVRASGPE